ncbi:MAG TPA: ATP-binding protein [Streptosporangiaceae bacterium]|jgi:anti-sigma regulatory factor (Ser/Thr protein kinase)|nr:ATP-binding protein [Streptosporangiaceae bacterium]
MTVAEMPIDAHHPAAPAVCRVRVWPLPPGSAHHAETSARTIIRGVLRATGTGRDEVLEAETIVAELAVNAVQHAIPPYELRIVFMGRVWPTWCEVADGGPGLERVRQRLGGPAVVSELTERGRGLVMVSGLSAGRCAAYLTTVCQTQAAGKAVGFALPGAGGVA